MTYIRVIPENDATGDLKAAYDGIRRARGKVADIMKVHSLDPRAMKAHAETYLAIMFGPRGLTRKEREMLAVAVSRENRCEYCVRHHAAALARHWKEPRAVEGFSRDWRSAPLTDRELALIAYGVKVARSPGEISREDVEALRKAGLGDEEILNACLVASYFCFVNRVALGLGVGLEPEGGEGYLY